jgi:hypothetical protein
MFNMDMGISWAVQPCPQPWAYHLLSRRALNHSRFHLPHAHPAAGELSRRAAAPLAPGVPCGAEPAAPRAHTQPAPRSLARGDWSRGLNSSGPAQQHGGAPGVQRQGLCRSLSLAPHGRGALTCSRGCPSTRGGFTLGAAAQVPTLRRIGRIQAVCSSTHDRQQN